MLLLTSTSDKIQVVTGSAADIEVHASWVDNASGTITPGRTNTAPITTGTTTDVVASPAASTQRNVRHLSLTNNHASASSTVAVIHTDGTNPVELREVTLLAGENLTFDNNGNWRHYDANGGEYPAVLPVATQADMEAASSLVLTVTPGRQHNHPSAAKCWYRVTVSAGVPTLAENYNVASITDSGLGLLTVTIGTDFSSANYCIVVSVQRVNTTAGETNARLNNVRSAAPAAGSFIHDCWDNTATTQLQADPQTWYGVCFGDQ